MPFGPYKNFEECVKDWEGKVDDPRAFCAWLHHELTGEWPGEARAEEVEKAKAKSEEHLKIAASQITLNRKGYEHARKLIEAGKYTTEPGWSFETEDEDRILYHDGREEPDWDEYSKWFLGTRAGTDPETKKHYAYPYGKNGKVYRSALIAARGYSSKLGHKDIFNAAGRLIEMIDEKEGRKEKAEMGEKRQKAPEKALRDEGSRKAPRGDYRK